MVHFAAVFSPGFCSAKSANTGAIVVNADDIHGQNRYSVFLHWLSENPQKSAVVAAKVNNRERLKSLGVLTANPITYPKTDSKINSKADPKNTSHFLLQKMIEKPKIFVSDLANTGMYYFTKNDLKRIPKNRQKTGVDEEFLTTDFVLPLTQFSEVFVVKTFAPWLIISTPDDVVFASQEVVKSNFR